MTVKVLCGDCRNALKTLPSNSVHCVVTSPPYYGLRSYCEVGSEEKQFEIGLEQTPEQYINSLVEVFREVKRVLREDGTCWLNLGDSYSNQGGKQVVNNVSNVSKLKPKNLIGIPWRVALALQADGWYLRQDIIWQKSNPMPESIKDRCTKSHEYIFLLTKSPTYYFDSVAIKEPLVRPNEGSRKTLAVFGGKNKFEHVVEQSRLHSGKPYTGTQDGMRNKRDVWLVATKPYKGAHFASFNIDLIDPCLRAGTSEKGVCSKCGKPYIRVVERQRLSHTELPKDDPRYRPNNYKCAYSDINGKGDAGYTFTKTLTFKPSCSCGVGEPSPATVLDPFGGSGTVGYWCKLNGRNAILIELNPAYIPLIEERLNTQVKLKPCKKTLEISGSKTFEETSSILSVDDLEDALEGEEREEYKSILIEAPFDAFEIVRKAYWMGKGYAL